MDSIAQDVKRTLRLLVSAPGYCAALLLSIALGVGGTAAVFSVVYGVLLRPLPYPEADRLVRIWEVHPGANAPLKNDLLSRPTYRAWSRHSSTLEDLASYSVGDAIVSLPGGAQKMRRARVTHSLFRLLRASPSRGRFFVAADSTHGASQVVVIADHVWRDLFHADASVIGKTLIIDDTAHEVIGVAPPRFRLPETDAAIYAPVAVPPVDPPGQPIAILPALARLKATATPAQAEAEGTSHARSVDRPFADLVFGSGQPVQVRVQPLVARMTQAVRPALLVLAAAVTLLLIVASANVANLLLARHSHRAREFAVRAALGARPRRLLRQLVTESLVISMTGGALGAFVGWALVAAMPLLAPADFPRVDQIRVDAWFLSAAAVAAVLAGLLAGAVPAVRGSRVDLVEAMHAGGARSVGGAGGRVRHALVVIEAALAVVLLIGAALLGRSLLALLHVDAGYQSAGVVTADIEVPRGADRAQRTTRLMTSLVDRLRAVPGVRAAGAGTMAPFGSVLNISGFNLPGQRADGRPIVARAFHTIITPGYAEALGMRLKEGRYFTAADSSSTVIAMLVNDTFAQTYLADGRPAIGRRFTGMFPKMLRRNDAVVTIVGVVDDVLPDRLDGRPQPQIYVPFGAGFDTGGATLVVRTDEHSTLTAPLLRSIVQQLDRGAIVDRVGPLADKVLESAAQPRFATFVLGAFAALALALAATGLYGVVSYNVARRTREFGVRGALGATRGDLVVLVLRQGLAMTTIGLAAGVGLAALSVRGMRTVLFGVQPLDGVAFVAAPMLLLAVASAACLIPARRAARIQPYEALRAD